MEWKAWGRIHAPVVTCIEALYNLSEMIIILLASYLENPFSMSAGKCSRSSYMLNSRLSKLSVFKSSPELVATDNPVISQYTMECENTRYPHN